MSKGRFYLHGSHTTIMQFALWERAIARHQHLFQRALEMDCNASEFKKMAALVDVAALQAARKEQLAWAALFAQDPTAVRGAPGAAACRRNLATPVIKTG